MKDLALGPSPIHGMGVFATRALPAGERLLAFYGPLVREEDLPEHPFGEDDRFLPLGNRLFLGPSGDVDDFVNHSCLPTARLRREGSRIELEARRPIAPGEEITFDYTETELGSWKMPCACGAPRCRKMIGAAP